MEAAQTCALEAAFETAPGAILEFGRGERLEERDGRPPILGGAREQVIEIVGAPGEAEATQVITQGRGDGRG
ncbi:MAG: hypothetical protein ACT4QD_26280 [Acidobacteriota bacterium]